MQEPRPGIARAVPVSKRTVLVISVPYRAIVAWFRSGSLASEGGLSAGRYYGSTSVALSWRDGPFAAANRAELGPILTRNPHIRLMACRIAIEEARRRTGAAHETARLDLRSELHQEGLRLHVDLELDLDLPLGLDGRGHPNR